MKHLVVAGFVLLLVACQQESQRALDPSAEAFLTALAEQSDSGESSEDLDPLDAWRKAMEDAIVLAGEPEHVEAIEEIGITSSDGEVRLRIYRSGEHSHKAVLYFHGGGFVGGNVDTIDTPLRRLANQSNRIVVSVEYRLAPENPYPAALEDALTALTYVSDHSDELGISKEHIAVMGDSAGGNIAASLAILVQEESGPEIEQQVLIYPNTDLTPEWSSRWASVEENREMLHSPEMLTGFFASYAQDSDPNRPTVSPVLSDDLSGLPPALIVTAGYDLLRDEGIAYAERLKEAGVSTRHWHYDDQIHGFFQFAAVIPTGGNLIDRIAAEIQ